MTSVHVCTASVPFFSHRKQGYLFRQPTQVNSETGFMNGNSECSRSVWQSLPIILTLLPLQNLKLLSQEGINGAL